MNSGSDARRIHPPPPAPPGPDDAEHALAWGFADTAFAFGDDGVLTLTGERYPLAGHRLPGLPAFWQDYFGHPIGPTDRVRPDPGSVPPPRDAPGLYDALRAVVGEGFGQDPLDRRRHGHGQAIEDIWALNFGAFERVVDAVVRPTSTEQVAALVAACAAHDAQLVPFGGGTSVTLALRCDPDDPRPVISLDLRRLNRIRWIDPVNRLACVEAGIIGRQLRAQLEAHGFTLGHIPDSVEFSTVGGWVATHASGMKKNRYGNIEDQVVDLEAVTRDGVLTHGVPVPRQSCGLDPRRWLLGSEGTLGVITAVTLRIFEKPESERYGSIVFPDLAHGVAFMRDLAERRALPASVRMMDNLQFRLGQSLKPERGGVVAGLTSAAQKQFLTRVLGFDLSRICAVTVLYEGPRDEVDHQQAFVTKLAKRHRGFGGGGKNGETGYYLTFAVIYLRDFMIAHGAIGDSFETSVAWSDTAALVERVKARVHREYTARGLEGRPFVSARISQAYHDGACVYFYIAFRTAGIDDPLTTYAELQAAGRDEVLQAGGSISHHHGVGQLRAKYLPRVKSPAALAWQRKAKRALDPGGVFSTRNQDIGGAEPG